MRRWKVLFLLLNASCAYFAIVMLYPSVSSLLSKKTDVTVPKQTPGTTTQSQKIWYQDEYKDRNIIIQTNLSMYTVFRRAIKDQVWVVINGWHLHNLYTNIQFFCCLLSQSKETKIVTVSKRKYFFGAAIGDRVAFQHQCKLENKPANKETIGASLVWRKNGSRTDPGLKNNVLCPKNENLYRLFDPVVDPENIGDNIVDLEDIGGRRTFDNLSGMNKPLNKNGSNFKLAICAKLAYGDLNINITIEWMEYHRRMGVSKVVLYQHKSLSTVARAVLLHYQKIGFVEVVPFDIPMTDQVKSYIGVNVRQAWEDEQVAVYDCQERLFRYKYIGLTDIDEFIVPYAYTTLQEVIEKMEIANPIAGAFRFFSDLHIIEWNASRNDETIVGSYLDWTNDTRAKSFKPLFRSDRVAPGGVWTHEINEFYKPYKEIFVPKQIARLLHYRPCRPELKKDICLSMKRTEDTRILSYMDESLRTSIKKTKKIFS